MVTAETLTDEQIRKFLDTPNLPRSLSKAARRALRVIERVGANEARMKARARIAAVINASKEAR